MRRQLYLKSLILDVQAVSRPTIFFCYHVFFKQFFCSLFHSHTTIRKNVEKIAWANHEKPILMCALCNQHMFNMCFWKRKTERSERKEQTFQMEFFYANTKQEMCAMYLFVSYTHSSNWCTLFHLLERKTTSFGTSHPTTTWFSSLFLSLQSLSLVYLQFKCIFLHVKSESKLLLTFIVSFSLSFSLSSFIDCTAECVYF